MNQRILTSLTLMSFLLSCLPAIAQTSSTVVQQSQTKTVVYRNTITNLNRAKNYARQAAEERNGGLQRYRAEASMHGPVEKTRFVENSDGTVTFTFYGGAPGAAPTIESVVTVAINSWRSVINYNGAIRAARGTTQVVVGNNGATVVRPSGQTTTVTYRNTITNLNRAKNYARQAAEERNGGLQRYRAEAIMHGPVQKTRLVENNDGTVTFTFYGGAPGATPTIESVVTVAMSGWRTVVNYNGAIRSR